jgi:SAM-dependent methyltransferase
MAGCRLNAARLSDQAFVHLRDYYFEPRNEWARRRIERVMKAAAPRAGERVLDLGCANGTFSFHARRLGARPVGLDRDPAVLATGREAARRLGGAETPRVRGDASRLPFRDGVFDVVINADFIEHLAESVKPPIFREMRRVMKAGGRGVVYSPNRNRVAWELRGENLKRLFGLRHAAVPRWQDFVDPDHFGLTTPSATARLLRRAGFRTRTEYFEFHVPLISRLPGMNFVLRPLLAAHFANRFLVRIRR